MKRKYADYRDKKDIVDSKLEVKRIDNEYFNGYLTRLEILEVRNKWVIDNGRCILDKNYVWIGIFPDNENYTITLMYDNYGELKEWYFDVSKGIGVSNDGIPYEDDLYLDLVIVPDGRYHVLDEDELKEALDNNDIDKELYDLAYKTLDYLKDKYLSNIEELKVFSKKMESII